MVTFTRFALALAAVATQAGAFAPLQSRALSFSKYTRVQTAAARPTPTMGKEFKVGVVGASGAVGVEIIGVLANRGFPVSSFHAFASARSAGKTINTPLGDVVVEEFSLEAAREMDVVFLAVDGDFAGEWAEKIAEGDGPYVIDNSSKFR